MSDSIVVIENPVYCPRCDRPYPDLETVKKHVVEQHPDHDPYWFETYGGPYYGD